MGDATTVAAAAADLGPAALDEQREIQLGSIQDHPDPGPRKAAHQGNGVKAANGLKKPGAGDGARAAAREKSHSLRKDCSPTAVVTPRLKASRSNFTVPQPFSLTTEKRATQAGSKPTVNGASKASQKSTPRKADPPATNKSFSTPSPSSENVGSTPKSRSEFVFRSVERAQKRMEFYANLTEKTKAREAERNRIQASTQQQVAAEIKKLRKDQTFKATPMPKFYQEPPPVRIDVKKTPPTRPKSPKLGRRASPASSTDAPPKIIARRSSDEYDVSKLPEQLHSLDPTTQVATPEEEHAESETLVLDTADFGSEHSSRKSDNRIPKAALSENEDHRHHEELPPDQQAHEAEDHSHSLETSRSSNDSPASVVAAAVDEDLDAALQLPVSSSLLDDDVYDEDGHQELGSEDDPDGFPSPTSDHDEEENVRVYISEEFRQAAAMIEQEEVEEEGVLRSNGEEEEEDEEDEDDHPKVYVKMDGIRAEREEELKHA